MLIKQFVDFICIIIFYILYRKNDIFYASYVLIFLSFLSFVMYCIFIKRIDKISLFVFLSVFLFCSLTILFHNDFFIKIKLSIVYSIFAFILLFRFLFLKKNFVKDVFSDKFFMSEIYWNNLNIYWIIFFIFCALINYYIACFFSQTVWIIFKVFGIFGLTLLFFVFNLMYILSHINKR